MNTWHVHQKLAALTWTKDASKAVQAISRAADLARRPLPSIPTIKEPRLPDALRKALAALTGSTLEALVRDYLALGDLHFIHHDNLTSVAHAVGIMRALKGVRADIDADPDGVYPPEVLAASRGVVYEGSGYALLRSRIHNNARDPFHEWVQELTDALFDEKDSSRPHKDAKLAGLILTVESNDPLQVKADYELLLSVFETLQGAVKASWKAPDWDAVRKVDAFRPTPKTAKSRGVAPDFYKASVQDQIPAVGQFAAWVDAQTEKASARAEDSISLARRTIKSAQLSLKFPEEQLVSALQFFAGAAVGLKVSKLWISQANGTKDLAAQILQASDSRKDPHEVITSGGSDIPVGTTIPADEAISLAALYPEFRSVAQESHFVAGVGLFGDPKLFNGILRLFLPTPKLEDGWEDTPEGAQEVEDRSRCGPLIVPGYPTTPGIQPNDLVPEAPVSVVADGLFAASLDPVLSYDAEQGVGVTLPPGSGQRSSTGALYLGLELTPKPTSLGRAGTTPYASGTWVPALAGVSTDVLSEGSIVPQGDSLPLLSYVNRGPLGPAEHVDMVLLWRDGGSFRGTQVIQGAYSDSETQTLSPVQTPTGGVMGKLLIANRTHTLQVGESVVSATLGDFAAVALTDREVVSGTLLPTIADTSHQTALVENDQNWWVPDEPGWLAPQSAFVRDIQPSNATDVDGVPPNFEWMTPSESPVGASPKMAVGSIYAHARRRLNYQPTGFSELDLPGLPFERSLWESGSLVEGMSPPDTSELVDAWGSEILAAGVLVHHFSATELTVGTQDITPVIAQMYRGQHPPNTVGWGSWSAASWALYSLDPVAKGVDVLFHPEDAWCFPSTHGYVLLDSWNHVLLYRDQKLHILTVENLYPRTYVTVGSVTVPELLVGQRDPVRVAVHSSDGILTVRVNGTDHSFTSELPFRAMRGGVVTVGSRPIGIERAKRNYPPTAWTVDGQSVMVPIGAPPLSLVEIASLTRL